MNRPFVGETAPGLPGLPTPPPTTLAGPIPGAPDTVRLMFPAAVPLAEVTDSLDLRSPSFGNKDRLSPMRSCRDTGLRVSFSRGARGAHITFRRVATPRR